VALPLTFLLGATAVGKSEVALARARRTGAAILALDAMQVYREAEIGTGKPTAGERAEIPHGGLDLAAFGANFSTADYLREAAGFLREQQAAGRDVVVVGGTGLYFRALTRGLCEAPPTPEALRAELEGLELADLRARLERIDPGMLGQLDGSNPRRVARAIAVMETTGRSLRAWQEETTTPAVEGFRAFWLQRERDELAWRIEARVEAMLAAGWLEEVRGLIERHGIEAVRAFPALGYRQLAEVLDGAAPLERARHAIVTATRQYAKRQLTWFAREPNLVEVMLSGPSISAALDSLA
jgi:tRNA dimethylallyltransferase